MRKFPSTEDVSKRPPRSKKVPKKLRSSTDSDIRKATKLSLAEQNKGKNLKIMAETIRNEIELQRIKKAQNQIQNSANESSQTITNRDSGQISVQNKKNNMIPHDVTSTKNSQHRSLTPNLKNLNGKILFL